MDLVFLSWICGLSLLLVWEVARTRNLSPLEVGTAVGSGPFWVRKHWFPVLVV